MSLHNKQKTSGSFSFGEFVWWMGVVEDRDDKEMSGRVRVRIFGYHTKDLDDIPKDKLMWAPVLMPANSASLGGMGVSPTGLLEGSHVFGFFADGHNAQIPIVFGSYPARPGKQPKGGGFCDPNGKYPEYEPDEQDVNRMARNEKIEETAVQKRRDDEDKDVTAAFGDTWSEITTPYAAKYPYNHVRETESHHIQEFDDTTDAERILLQHKSGSFREMHPDGTEVHKVKKDLYELVYGDDFVHIRGNCKITIDGDASLYVKGDAAIEVDGDLKQHVHGDYALNVDGDMKVQVDGDLTENSDSTSTYTAPRIDLNP